jgi:ribosomal protein L13E
MMRVRPVVKRKRKAREGKGFSREELREVGLSFGEALRQGIPIDTRRSTKHEENVKKLNAYSKALRPKPPLREKRAKIVDLTEVKGIGSRTAKKLK